MNSLLAYITFKAQDGQRIVASYYCAEVNTKYI